MLVAALVAFTLPAAAAVIYLSLRPLWAGDGRAHVAVGLERTYRGIALHTVFFVLALQVFIVLNLLGPGWLRPVAPRAVVVLVGLFLAAIGNALPRTRPNLLFGIRTARTLDDRQLWMRLHRAAGYVAVIAGVAIAMAAVLLSKDGIAWVVAVVALGGTAALSAIYIAGVPAIEATREARARRRRAIASWSLRVLLAALFFYFGLEKFPGGPGRMWVRLFDAIGFGQWFRIFTGFVEAGGALLLLVPRGVVAGAAVLCAAMMGALLAHVLVIGIGRATFAVAVLLVLLIGVALASRTRAS